MCLDESAHIGIVGGSSVNVRVVDSFGSMRYEKLDSLGKSVMIFIRFYSKPD